MVFQVIISQNIWKFRGGRGPPRPPTPSAPDLEHANMGMGFFF